MDAYVYQADLLCEDCGPKIQRKLDKAGKAPADPSDEHSYDSDEYPKGPYADGGGESDVPSHCSECGVFLENSLTEAGYDYVKELIADYFKTRRGDKKVLKKWADFYDIEFKGDRVAKKNPRGTSGWRSYGPGKYNSIVDSYVHALDTDGWGDQEVGDVADFGWYGLMGPMDTGELLKGVADVAREEKDDLTPEERLKLKTVVGVIIHENDQGFVSIEYFNSEKSLKKAWEKVAEEAEAFYEGAED